MKRDRSDYSRAYYAKNRDRLIAYQRAYYADPAHIEKRRAQRHAYYERHRDEWAGRNPMDEPPLTKAGLPDQRWGRRWGSRRPENKRAYMAVYDRLPERRAAALAARQRKGTKPRPGWTRELRRERLREQGGLCAICHCAFGVGCVPQQDHNAATRIARGMLCVNCNHLLGKAKDSIANLESAIAYLRRYDQ